MVTREWQQDFWKIQPRSSISEAKSIFNTTYSYSFHHEANVTDSWEICWLVNCVNRFNMAGYLSKPKVFTVQRSMHYTIANLK